MLQVKEDFFGKKRKAIFKKLYISNVRNRLRELVNPNDVDCKRWVWELVQNAKDSIAGQPNKKVDVEIIVKSDTYIFKHNGSPFNEDTLFGLLYKFSEGKTNNYESTGRFGTGFLTTHALSKTVEIQGDIYRDNETTPVGFSVTMYREGEDQELLEGLDKTEKSLQFFNNPFHWTTYKYKATTERNKEAGQLGIQNFKDNIDKVMLFCPEINSIKLDDNGKILTIKPDNNPLDLPNECQFINFTVNDNNQISKKIFLCNKVEEYNEMLTKRFKKSRNLRICCALEIDSKSHDICINTSSPCLFCSLPLVGSEAHELPFIINSPDFEPDSERQSIFLDGEEIDEKTGIISDVGINKMILKESQEMYKNILFSICSINIGKRYMLARGLRSIPNVTKYFDREWYKDSFMSIMRALLLLFPIVFDGQQYMSISDSYIPNYEKERNKKQAYTFISQIYSNTVPSFDESIHLEKYIWRDEDYINFVDIEECVKRIEKCGDINTFKNNIDVNVWDWLNTFLPFVKRYHPEYLEKYAIIPNMNLKFVNLNDSLATSLCVPENIIECLENLDIHWKETHIHKNIKKFTPGTDHNIDIAVSEICRNLTEWSNKVLYLMQYIPWDCEDKQFIQKREMIFEICSVMWNEDLSEMKDGSGFPRYLWNGVDEMVLKNLLLKIEEYNEIQGKISVDYINKVLVCVQKYYSDYIDYSIIPNQNKKLCKLNELYEDSNIPEIFKNCLKNCFNVDIRNELLDKGINTKVLRFVEKKEILSYKSTLKKFFSEKPKSTRNIIQSQPEYISSNIKKEAAEYLIRIVPRNKKCNQRILFDLYQIFTKKAFKNDEYCEINDSDDDDFGYGIWDDSNKYIYKIIREVIERNDTVNSLANDLNRNNKEILSYLNSFINRFSENGKIVPNQYGDFCELEDLMNEGDYENDFTFYLEDIRDERIKLIPEELKDIAKDLEYDIKAILVHKSMNRPCLKSMSYNDMCRKIDGIIKEKYNDKSTYTDKKFKNAAYNLIEKYFKTINEDEKTELFTYSHSVKSNIMIDVIIDESARETLVNIRNEFDDDEIDNLLKNSKEIKELLKNNKLLNNRINLSEFDDNEIDNLVKNSHEIKKFLKNIEFSKNKTDLSNSEVIGSGLNSIKIIYNSGIKSYEKGLYNEVFSNIIKYGNDFYFENRNENTGITGEAYIYELLLNSGKFKNVTWKMMNFNGRKFDYNGTVYYIQPDDSHYDIEVETFSNSKFFIEVKSTKNELSNKKVPFFISKKQIDMMKLTTSPNKYILAVVFNVMSSNPSHFFLTMNENITKNTVDSFSDDDITIY